MPARKFKIVEIVVTTDKVPTCMVDIISYNRISYFKIVSYLNDYISGGPYYVCLGYTLEDEAIKKVFYTTKSGVVKKDTYYEGEFFLKSNMINHANIVTLLEEKIASNLMKIREIQKANNDIEVEILKIKHK